MQITAKERDFDSDRLRVPAIFLFHNGCFFNEEHWHVRNFELSFGISLFVATLDHVVTSLLSVFWAIAIYHTLTRCAICLG